MGCLSVCSGLWMLSLVLDGESCPASADPATATVKLKAFAGRLYYPLRQKFCVKRSEYARDRRSQQVISATHGNNTLNAAYPS